MKNTIKTLVTLALLVIINGCGGDGGGEAPSNTNNKDLDKPKPFVFVPPPPRTVVYAPLKSEEYNLSIINGVESRLKYSGKGVIIGVVDGGFDINLDENDSNSLLPLDILNTEGYFNHYKTTDSGIRHGHGIIKIIGDIGVSGEGASWKWRGTKGITEGASFVIGQSSSASTKYYEMNVFGAGVINNSWRSVDNISLRKEVANAIFNLAIKGNNGKGIVFVFGAGNEKTYFPKNRYANVNENNQSIDDFIIYAGSLDKDDKRKDYSNNGVSIDIFVSDDVIIDFEKKGIYEKGQGTSVASAIVTSIVALGLEARGDLNSSVIANLICKTATQIGDKPYDIVDLNGNKRSKTFGCGKLNTNKFITAIEEF
jgi:predicted small lipoprotein YifL